MKKNVIIFSATLIILSLTAFGFINRNNSVKDQIETTTVKDVAVNSATMENRVFTDFIYDIGPRSGAIKKEEINKLTSFADLIGEKHANRIVSYKSLSVIIMNGDTQSDVRVDGEGNSGMFNDAQIKFMQSLPYSTNFLVWADYTEKNENTGALEDVHWTPYLTIVPEKQAVYVNGGMDALKEFLKENIKEYTSKVQPDKLQPAKLYFTVTKEGQIENIKLDRSSNFPIIDEKMIELMTKLPGTWQPAENAKGEKVDQELVASFGLMGC